MNDVINRMEEKWNNGATSYNKTHVDNENSELWLETIGQLLGSDNNKSLLDVGTGTGFIILKAAQLGFKCTGLDMSEAMMDEAKKHASETDADIWFVKSYVEETPFSENTFDIVTNRSLMWTLTEPQRALTEWRRILKFDGRLCCFCHISANRGQHNHYEQDIEDMLPLKTAPAEAYISELLSAGFRNVQAVRLPQLPSIHGGTSSEESCWYAFLGVK